MDEKLQRLVDENEIRRLLALYTRGVDRGDAALVSSVYHPKSTDDHGAYKGPGKDFGAFVTKALGEHTDATAHTLNQCIIDIKGDRARAETYFVAYHVRREGSVSYLDTFGGRYVDELVKELGEWLIMDRVVVRDWSKTETVQGSYYSPDDFVGGKRSREDLAYKPL